MTEALDTKPQSPDSTKVPGLVVHHLNNSRSQRVLWLLEELEVPYTIKKYERVNMRAPPELKAVHPLGHAPLITEGDTTLAESGAIIEYLIEKYGGTKEQPPPEGKLDNLYYTHYPEGTLMPLLVNKLIFTIIPKRSPWFLRPIMSFIFNGVAAQMVDPGIKENAEMVEAHLAKSASPWFAGGPHPTSADYMMSFPLEALASGRADDVIGSVPKIKEWVATVHARPAYQRALEKGGKYAYA